MDLSFTPTRPRFGTRCARSSAPRFQPKSASGLKGEHVSKADLVLTQRAMNAAGLAVPHWPVAWGGKDWTSVQSYIGLDEMQSNSVRRHSRSYVDGWPRDRRIRQRGAEAAFPATDGQSRHLVVPRLLRTWRRGRIGVGGSAHNGPARGRRVGGEWAEDLDDFGAVCRLDSLPVRTDPNAAKKQEGILHLIDMKTRASPCGRSRPGWRA